MKCSYRLMTVVIVVLMSLITSVQAELVITEIMSDSDHLGSTDVDWWELSNTGPYAVNLSGYSWDDNHQRPGQNTFSAITIGVGQSIILHDNLAGAEATWRSEWNLPATVQMYGPSSFGGGFSGLGSSDGIYLYNSSNTRITFVTYPVRTGGHTNAWALDGSYLGISQDGMYEAYQSTNIAPDIGSPGVAIMSIPCPTRGRMLYWTDKDADKIQRMKIDGDCVQDLLTSQDGLADPRGLIVDEDRGVMYLTDMVNGTLSRARLDGSSKIDLVTGLSSPADIAMDWDNGRIYIAETFGSRISSVDINGQNMQTVISGINQPYYLVMNTADQMLYWGELDNSVIYRVKSDGSGFEQFITGLDHVRDIVLDVEDNKIYWCERDISKIQRKNLDGSGAIEDLFGPEDGLGRPHGLWLDDESDLLYWTDTVTSSIHKGNKDGIGGAEVVVSALDGPWVVTIAMVQKKIYVDDDATGTNDGSSWVDAYPFLQDALAEAEEGDTICVAQGTYTPDKSLAHPGGTDDREATFEVDKNLVILGSFAGVSNGDPNKRNVKTMPSILSGDLAGDDDIGVVDDQEDLLANATRSENSYHVMTYTRASRESVLDGFMILSGNANGTQDDETDRAAGLYLYGHYQPCNPTIKNCTFAYNSVGQYGGGIMCFGHGDGECKPMIMNCTFRTNSSSREGGGINIWEAYPVVYGCSFINNYASTGAGISGIGFDYAGINYTLIINSVFDGNKASAAAGAFFAIEGQVAVFINCTMAGNVAAGGIAGGIACQTHCNVSLLNSILWANQGSSGINENAQVYDYSDDSTIEIYNSCLQGWTGILGGDDDTGINPQFVDADGVDNLIGTIDDDLRLKTGSICIEGGNNSYVGEPVTTDISGLTRIVDGDCDGGATVDMGAYEYASLWLGDVNMDCQVDLDDVALMQQAWQSEPEDTNWNRNCDIAFPYDSVINLQDLNVLAGHWLYDYE